MKSNEHDASRALGAYYDERARWLQVLGRPAVRPVRKAPAKKSLIARLLGL